VISTGRLVVLEMSLLWKLYVRNVVSPAARVLRPTLWLVQAFAVVNCLAIGYFLEPILRIFLPQCDGVSLVEAHIGRAFLAFCVLRLFMEKPPSLIVQPMLVLPVPKTVIIGLHGIRMSLTAIPLGLLLGGVAFWYRSILSSSTVTGSSFWLVGFVALHHLFVVLGIPLRLLASDFFRAVAVSSVILVLTLVVPTMDMLGTASQQLAVLFFRLRHGDAIALAICGLALFGSIPGVAFLVKGSLNIDTH